MELVSKSTLLDTALNFGITYNTENKREESFWGGRRTGRKGGRKEERKARGKEGKSKIQNLSRKCPLCKNIQL